jgi:hypothetical protein
VRLPLLPLHSHKALLPFQQNGGAVQKGQGVRRSGKVGAMQRFDDESSRTEKINQLSADCTMVREHRDHGHFRHCCLLYRA